MKRKWVIFSAVLLGCSALGYFLLPQLCRKKQIQFSHLCIKGSYFHPVKVTKSFSQLPCVDIRIEDKIATAIVDLGFSGDVALPKNLMEELQEKSFIQSISYFGIRGKKYNSDVYELPKIKIGAMTLFQAKAREINPEFEKDATILESEEFTPNDDLGRVGWPLFHNFNFFLDCENSLIAFCDSLDTLKKQGYPVDLFIETSLLLERNSIEFEAIAERGTLRCVLDTGSTQNMLNKDIEGSNNEHMIFNPDTIDQHEALNPTNSDQMLFDPENIQDVPFFKIGKKDFGPLTFQKIRVPFEIDAIIGMEFLNSTLIFIDFPNRKLYFYKK